MFCVKQYRILRVSSSSIDPTYGTICGVDNMMHEMRRQNVADDGDEANGTHQVIKEGKNDSSKSQCKRIAEY